MALPQPGARPSTVLLFRGPVLPSEGTDPYHDAFGQFCLPSFPLSALDSGAATPVSLPPKALRGGAAAREESHGASMGSTGQQGPRPEELLLEALQHQQQKQQQTFTPKSKIGDPQRDYTRQQPEGRNNVDTDSDSKCSPLLTTHHISTQPMKPSQAARIGLSKTPDSSSFQREWCVTSLPVIGSQDANGEQLEKLLLEWEWSAVVATSNRAWDAWKRAAARCQSKGKAPLQSYANTPFFLISSRAAASFRSKTLPTVPTGFAPAMHKVFGAPSAKGGAKGEDNDAGATKGSSAGEALGNYIVSYFEQRRGPGAGGSAVPRLTDKPLLLLQGDKSLAALPTLLTTNGIEHEDIVVYETCGDGSIERNVSRVCELLKDLAWNEEHGANLARSRRGSGASSGSNSGASPLSRRQAAKSSVTSTLGPEQRCTLLSASPERSPTVQAFGGNGDCNEAAEVSEDIIVDPPSASSIAHLAARPDFLVFFSPSGVDFCAPFLSRRGWFPADTPSDQGGEPRVAESRRSSSRPRFVALGPTTAAHLKSKYGFIVVEEHVQRDFDPVEQSRSDSWFVAVAEKPEPAEVREAITRLEEVTPVAGYGNIETE